MEPIKINCPHCGNRIEYWTKSNSIQCPKCNGAIKVDPCTEPLSHELPEEGEEDATRV